ncbi:hypothetical protein [Nostoc sp. CALU 1950]
MPRRRTPICTAIALAQKRKAIACPLTNVVRPPATIEITRFWIQ